MPPVARPEDQRPGARRAIRARELHLAASSHIGIDLQRVRPYDGHGDNTALDPFSQPWPDEGEEGSLTSIEGRQNPGPPAGSQAATSRKSMAGSPTRMLRKSGRQHLVK